MTILEKAFWHIFVGIVLLLLVEWVFLWAGLILAAAINVVVYGTYELGVIPRIIYPFLCASGGGALLGLLYAKRKFGIPPSEMWFSMLFANVLLTLLLLNIQYLLEMLAAFGEKS